MHEGGHHVMLRHRGIYEVDSWIERVGDPTLYERAWIGRCRWRKPHPDGRDLMIGVAGMMAETLWKARNDLICIDDVFDLLDDQNCISDLDWCQKRVSDRDAGFTDEQRRQIEVAFDLLRGPLWSELLRQARKLIVELRYID